MKFYNIIKNQKGQTGLQIIASLGIAGFGTLCLLAVMMWGCPQYNVWAKGMSGRAQLAEAEYNRQITIQEAKAKLEAAKSLAEAEIERAKGVAAANKIIGESLQGHDEYLRYLWITGLEAGSGRETVYIPTEAGLPILEANRFNQPVEE